MSISSDDQRITATRRPGRTGSALGPVLGGLAVSAAIWGVAGGVALAQEAKVVGIARNGRHALETVTKVLQDGDRTQFIAYVTHVDGVDDGALFSNPAARSEATAYLTMTSASTFSARYVNGNIVSTAADGTATVYVNSSPGASFDRPESFSSGTPVATFTCRLFTILNVQVPLSTQSPGRGIASSTIEMLQTAATPFSLGGSQVVLGTVGTSQHFVGTGQGTLTAIAPFQATFLGGGYATTASSRPATNVWTLPSSAHLAGAGGSFFTTDLTVGNIGTTDAPFTLKFLGNNKDGTAGVEKSFTVGAGKAATYADVLGTVFGETAAFGAIRISSPSPSLNVVGQTSTPGFGGTFGQTVPAASPDDLVTADGARSIVGIREDAAFRTNLVLANATTAEVSVDATLVDSDGARLGAKRYVLPPLGMTQETGVVRKLGVTSNVTGAQIVLATPTAGGAVAAYAAVIDNATNDPRSLLPR